MHGMDSAPVRVESRESTGGIRDIKLEIELAQQHSRRLKECRYRDDMERDGGGEMEGENAEAGETEFGFGFEKPRGRGG